MTVKSQTLKEKDDSRITTAEKKFLEKLQKTRCVTREEIKTFERT
jgi:hypothetical protein